MRLHTLYTKWPKEGPRPQTLCLPFFDSAIFLEEGLAKQESYSLSNALRTRCHRKFPRKSLIINNPQYRKYIY